jgi:hypothetical protein
MGKLVNVIVLIGVVVGGWFGYQKYLAPASPAYLAYQQYADALAREQYDRAENLSTGDAHEAVVALRRQMAGTSINVYGKSLAMRPPSVQDVAGEVHSIRWSKESESTDESGVNLAVVETVCRIPPGVNSAMCKWPVDFRHDVSMASDGGTWKVASFEETRITP